MSDQTVQSTQPHTQQSTLMKDLMIPVSIIIAGGFIGAGLYFGGGQASSTGVAAPTQAAEADDKTSLVNPVTAADHIRGSLEAPVKIIEFSDYDCPFCTRYHTAMQEITSKYSGDEVAWVYRHFPLEQLHPQAAAVALASECVAELGGNDAFWEFTDSYMTARGSGDKTAHNELIPKLVLGVGVSQQAFTECYDSGRHNAAIQEDMTDAVETGGRGTPWSILVGPSGKTYPINGALPAATIENLIKLAKEEAY
ncbi:MAG: DsbA family protein [Candidatus Kaiserbacteria bacterium]|nr:DsbA family protein [Candidatus Kaiserbacteria bacterium]MCB9815859.1 DsbA family protein [Candidatus Nomurabacteria bacterium]